MGCLFLLFQSFRVLLGAGRLLTFALDVLYCCLCAAAVFLCALGIDSGRLRLYQAALQLLGGWAAATALGPAVLFLAKKLRTGVSRAAVFSRRLVAAVKRRLKKIAAKLLPKRPILAKKVGKSRKNRRKAQKKT